MTTQELIEEVARIWVENGGDADGIAFCWLDIKRAVEIEISERNS